MPPNTYIRAIKENSKPVTYLMVATDYSTVGIVKMSLRFDPPLVRSDAFDRVPLGEDRETLAPTFLIFPINLRLVSDAQCILCN